MEFEPTTAAEAVANGAQLLDERVPDWHRIIDQPTLDLSDCKRCVAGQLATALGRRALPGEATGYHEDFGFDMKTDFDTTKGDLVVLWEYGDLDAEWLKAIQARLEADALKPAEEREEILA